MAKKRGDVTARFTREQLAVSRKYAGLRDVIMIVLEEGEEYTFDEVDSKLEGFLGKKFVEKRN